VISYWGFIVGIYIPKPPPISSVYLFCFFSYVLICCGIAKDIYLRQALIPLVEYIDIIESYFRNNEKENSQLVGWQQFKKDKLDDKLEIFKYSTMEANKKLYWFWIAMLVINSAIQLFFILSIDQTRS
jgi:hypothetical protein